MPVSQFTLLASVKKGNKPDFHQAAAGLKARELYRAFFQKVQDSYDPEKVKDGIFAAMMDVQLVNDGPVGLDYTCLDGEVHPHCFSAGVYRIFWAMLTCAFPGHYLDRY
jgi:D-tyrosyl-tRNA(Tyr) deacylase